MPTFAMPKTAWPLLAQEVEELALGLQHSQVVVLSPVRTID